MLYEVITIVVTLAIYQNNRLMNSLETTPKEDGSFSFTVTVNPEGSSELFGPDILYCADYCHFKSGVSFPAGDVRLLVTAADPAGRQAESERHVITSYSIHYTKLYDGTTSGDTQPPPGGSSVPARP